MVIKMAAFWKSSGLHICIISILALGMDGVVSHYGGPAPGQLTCGSRLVSGIFQRPQLPLGYTLLATIPTGACRINVTEMRNSNNYLALKTTNGSFVINGNFAISWSGEYEAAGTKFLYRHQGGSIVEAISAPGPLTQPIDIMILCQHPNPGIKYEYTVQVPENEENEQPPPQPRPSPHDAPSSRHHIVPSSHHSRNDHVEASPPDPISRSSVVEVDGNSIEPRRPDRMDSDRFPYGPGVLATESEKPTHVTQRHRRRKFIWQMSKHTSCSKTCAGVQMPVLVCVREYNQSPAAERRCGPRPNSANVAKPCGGPCPARWVPLPWGPCSATCGYALQTRQIHCRQDLAHHSLNVKMSDSMCSDNPPPTSQKCQIPDCSRSNNDDRDEVQLKSNDLSPPSTGYSRSSPDPRPGLRNRSFRDREETDRFSDAATPVIIARFSNDTQGRRAVPSNGRSTDELSNEISSPEGGRSAGNSFRSNGGGHWKAGNAWIYSEWTQECSEECGRGVQTRSVRCADPSGCDERQRPLDSRACSSDRKCSTQSSKWFTGPWSQCSNPCAINGRMTREVVCMSYYRGQHKVNTGGCNQQAKPEADVPCPPSMLRGDCEPEWFSSDWSQCLGSCGSTHQTRLVTCQSSSGGPEGSCKLERPSNRRDCVPSHCHLGGITPRPDTNNENKNENSIDDPAVTGECSDKIVSCHLAVQARLCQYKYYASSCCASCSRAPALS